MIEPVINHINTQIAALSLFEKLHGLSEIIQKEKGDITQQFPAEYCAGGEYKHIEWDYKNGVLYHRQVGEATIEDEPEQSIDGCDTYQIYTYPMRMVMVVSKTILTKKNDDAYIGKKIVHNIRNAITTTNSRSLNSDLSSEVVSITVTDFTTDRYAIHDEETENVEFHLNFDKAVIAIDYEVKIEGSSSCFDDFGCDEFTPVVHYILNNDLVDAVGSNNLTANTIGTPAGFTAGPTSEFAASRDYPSQRDAYDRRNGGITGIAQGNIDRAIALWVKFTGAGIANPNAETLVYFGSGLNDNLSIYKAISGSTYVVGGASTFRDTGQAINSTDWQWIVFNYHRNRTVEFYVDNVLADSATLGGDLAYADGDIFIGSNPNDPNNPNDNTAFRFNGEVADVRFYEEILTAKKRAAIYNGGQGTPESTLMA